MSSQVNGSTFGTEQSTSTGMQEENVNKFASGDVAWTMTCTALVWLMVPGIGFFYSGMARTSSALSLIILSCWSIAVVSIQVKLILKKKLAFFFNRY
jgi:Amt family ammonium transporter